MPITIHASTKKAVLARTAITTIHLRTSYHSTLSYLLVLVRFSAARRRRSSTCLRFGTGISTGSPFLGVVF